MIEAKQDEISRWNYSWIDKFDVWIFFTVKKKKGKKEENVEEEEGER